MANHTNPQTVSVTFDPDTDAFCPSCNYNLRGSTGAHCVECGAPFILAKPGPSQRYGFYLITLACTSYLAIPVLTYLPTLLILTFSGRWPGFWTTTTVIHWACNLLAVPYLILLVCLRHRITQSNTVTRIAWFLPPLLILLGVTLMNWITAIRFF